MFSEANKLYEAGVMAMVLEMVPDEIAEELTESLESKSREIFTIGIGAGQGTSGQVLVTDDLLGRFNLFKPRFVKRYAEQYQDMTRAFQDYKSEVQELKFPEQQSLSFSKNK